MVRKESKLIRVRVSEEDLQILRDACDQKGVAKIGDLALQTMHELIKTPKPGLMDKQSSHLWIKEITNRLTSLQAEVERLEILLNLKR